MVYAGEDSCYGKCNETIRKFLALEISSTQVYRVADYYGKQVSSQQLDQRSLPPADKEDTVYVQVDGSMVLTREQGWKEVKLGRIFKGSDCIGGTEKRSGWITKSQYYAHLGSSSEFIASFNKIVNGYGKHKPRMVFINDGATWIRNWIEDNFDDDVISILDYYHALEYLHDFAKSHFKEPEEKEKWVEIWKLDLLSSRVEKVIADIEALNSKSSEASKVIEYYQRNTTRMDYKRYKQIGIGIIGSGAIESAHRTVIQERMKLSGQRWSKSGAQHMLNLRTVKMNNQWEKIISLVKTEVKNAA